MVSVQSGEIEMAQLFVVPTRKSSAESLDLVVTVI
jgi:hypothetical protein